MRLVERYVVQPGVLVDLEADEAAVSHIEVGVDRHAFPDDNAIACGESDVGAGDIGAQVGNEAQCILRFMRVGNVTPMTSHSSSDYGLDRPVEGGRALIFRARCTDYVNCCKTIAATVSPGSGR
jgi:hypothetical protein